VTCGMLDGAAGTMGMAVTAGMADATGCVAEEAVGCGILSVDSDASLPSRSVLAGV
jgi:hypothetical protein